ncbi:hypothetical protein R6Q59_001680 [Mikania micrantha]
MENDETSQSRKKGCYRNYTTLIQQLNNDDTPPSSLTLPRTPLSCVTNGLQSGHTPDAYDVGTSTSLGSAESQRSDLSAIKKCHPRTKRFHIHDIPAFDLGSDEGHLSSVGNMVVGVLDKYNYPIFSIHN